MLWACQAVDVAYVNDMRNFLGLGNVPDLSSIDVFRGRDCGVASYADARQHYGLRRPTVMSDLTNVPSYATILSWFGRDPTGKQM